MAIKEEAKRAAVVYPVLFTQTHDERDTVLIEIPDLNGLTEGFGMADAIMMARDYIGSACYEKEESELPKASDLNEVLSRENTFDGDGDTIASLVDIDLEAYKRKMNSKSVRKNVTLPCWLNELAEKEHINVSRILQEALMDKLGVAR